jgi:hypothetical protein
LKIIASVLRGLRAKQLEQHQKKRSLRQDSSLEEGVERSFGERAM